MNKPPTRTPILVEAAALVAAGARFVGLEQRSHRTYDFVLMAGHADCEALLKEYRDGTLTVRARAMAEAMTLLKDAVFGELRDRERHVRNPTRADI